MFSDVSLELLSDLKVVIVVDNLQLFDSVE